MGNGMGRKKLNQDLDHVFKVVLVGDSDVGKSSMLLQFRDGCFNQNLQPTIGIDFKVKVIECGNSDGTSKRVKLSVWDPSGQQRFRTLTSAYYRGAHAVFFVYDVTSMASFQHLSSWLALFDKNGDMDAVKVLVGNKVDGKRVVEREMAEAFAAQHGMLYFSDTSAKTSVGIAGIFQQASLAVVMRLNLLPNSPQPDDCGAVVSSKSGDATVGKASLVDRSLSESPLPKSITDFGDGAKKTVMQGMADVTITILTVSVDGGVQTHLAEVAGTGAVVFDVSQRSSYESVQHWIQQADPAHHRVLALCANKVDLPSDSWQVQPEEYKEFALRNKLMLFEYSNAVDSNPDELFNWLFENHIAHFLKSVDALEEETQVTTETLQPSDGDLDCSDPTTQDVLLLPTLNVYQSINTALSGVELLTDLHMQLSAFAADLEQLKLLRNQSGDENEFAELGIKIADTNAKMLAIEAEVSIVHTRLLQGEQHAMEVKSLSEWAVQQRDSFPSWVHELQLTPSHIEVLSKWEGLDFNAAALLDDVECTAANVQTMLSEIEEMKANISKVKQQNADESAGKFRDLLKDANSVQARGAILDPKYRDCVEQHYLQKHAVLLEVAGAIESKFNEHILVASLLKTKKFESTGGKVACALGLMAIITDQLPFGSIVSSVAGMVASEVSGGRREERYGRLSALVDGSSASAAAVLAQKIGRKVALTDQTMIFSKAKKSSKDVESYAAILAGSCLEVVLRGAFSLTDIRATAKSKGKDWIEEVIEAGIIRTNNILTNKKMFVLEQHELRQLATEMGQHHVQHAPQAGHDSAAAIAAMQMQMKQLEDMMQHVLKDNQRLQREIDGLKGKE